MLEVETGVRAYSRASPCAPEGGQACCGRLVVLQTRKAPQAWTEDVKTDRQPDNHARLFVSSSYLPIANMDGGHVVTLTLPSIQQNLNNNMISGGRG